MRPRYVLAQSHSLDMVPLAVLGAYHTKQSFRGSKLRGWFTVPLVSSMKVVAFSYYQWCWFRMLLQTFHYFVKFLVFGTFGAAKLHRSTVFARTALRNTATILYRYYLLQITTLYLLNIMMTPALHQYQIQIYPMMVVTIVLGFCPHHH